MRFAIAFYGFLSRQDYRRRWYNGPTPLLGGLTIFASLIVCNLFFNYEVNPLYFSLLPLVFIGILDDQREISYKLKFLFQFVSIGIWVYLTPYETIFLYKLGFTPLLSYLLSCLWLLTIINAVKMLDGMDGLVSGFGIIVSAFMLMLHGDLQNPQLILTLAGALCGFIFWNLKPAQIYLGGVGAYLISFILGTQLLTWTPANSNLTQILVPLFNMALPEVNILLAVFRGLSSGRSVFLKDGQYIYHRVLRSGFSVTRAWLLLMTAVVMLAQFAVLIEVQNNLVILGGFSLFMSVLFSYLLVLIYQIEGSRKDYFDQYLQNLFKEHLKPLDLVEVSAEDCLIVYSFSDFRDELLRLKNAQLERWLIDSVQFIKTQHSRDSQIFMSLDGDLLILDPKINGALRFHNFHQKFHDYMVTSANHNEYWPLLLLKYMPIIEVGRLPGNIEVTISEVESGKAS